MYKSIDWNKLKNQDVSTKPNYLPTMMASKVCRVIGANSGLCVFYSQKLYKIAKIILRKYHKIGNRTLIRGIRWPIKTKLKIRDFEKILIKHFVSIY